MNKKKVILISIFPILTALVVGGIVLLTVNPIASATKSAYEVYKESHPGYNKSESEWLDDLKNGVIDYTKSYTVSFDSDGGSAVESQIVSKGDKITEPNAPIKKGYTFDKWTYKGNPWLFYGFTVSEDIVLKASWTVNNYLIQYDLNGGTIVDQNPESYTIESEFTFNEPTRVGYTFSGWFDSNDKKIDSIQKGMVGDLALKASWNANKYLLTVLPENPLEGSVDILSGERYVDETISIKAIPNTGLVFKGWYIDDELVSRDNPYTFVMPPHDYSLVAKFGETRSVSVFSSDESSGIVSGSGDYIIGETVTIACDIKTGVLKGWQNEDGEIISSSSTYSFIMPSHDCSFTAIFMTEEEIEEYIWEKDHGVMPVFSEDLKSFTYGMYPQNVELDSNITSYLGTLISPESNGYYLYEKDDVKEYYAKAVACPMDFGIGSTGEKIKSYFDDGVTEIVNGKEYWFKVMPIKWNVLNDKEDSYLALTDKLLDISQYYSSFENRQVDSGSIIYPNNYEHSDVRNWLTNDFYNSAFNLDDDSLLVTEVNNSAATTGTVPNIYECENTFDKIWLPSYSDYLNTEYGFVTSPSSTRTRLAVTTDYSRAKGAWYSNKPTYLNCGYSWLRSPGNEYEIEAWRLSYGGGLNHHNDVTIDNSCIRAMINLKKQ